VVEAEETEVGNGVEEATPGLVPARREESVVVAEEDEARRLHDTQSGPVATAGIDVRVVEGDPEIRPRRHLGLEVVAGSVGRRVVHHDHLAPLRTVSEHGLQTPPGVVEPFVGENDDRELEHGRRSCGTTGTPWD